MEQYHIRRRDKAIDDKSEIERILRTQRYMTVAMCRGDEPYLVTLNHGYDLERKCVYFHCAAEGKKIDFLHSNPKVWGIVIEDLGYADGKCDHFFRSVIFRGRVRFLEQEDQKLRALETMIRQQESEPEKVMANLITNNKIAEVTIGRIDIEELSGKQFLNE